MDGVGFPELHGGAHLGITPIRHPSVVGLERQFIYLSAQQAAQELIEDQSSKAVLILAASARGPGSTVVRRSPTTGLCILFDSSIPHRLERDGTVRTLAGMARFIIVWTYPARSVPQELQAIIPDLMVPIRPVIAAEDEAWAMFTNFLKYPWVVREPFRYSDLPHLIHGLRTDVIDVAENKLDELVQLRAETTDHRR